MNNKFKTIVVIADVHIGNKAISPDEYKYQLKKGVIDKLNLINFLDGIVLAGDTLHTKVPLNSEYANIFFKFIYKLVKIAKKYNAFIRIIKGTRSHDNDQLDNIKFYEDDKSINFKVIDTKCIEEIDGYIYGYIPEEYVSDDDNYYKEFYNKPNNYFDMIFMHGLIEQCQFMKQDSENFTTKTPVFNIDKLARVTRGPIMAGHIHTPMNFKNKFFYVGSTLRTCHGEEQPKGWDIVTYIKNESLYRVDRIINEYTFNFNTLRLNSLFMENNTVDEIIKYINNFRKKNKTDKLLLKITCIDYKETTAKIQILKKYFLLDNSITTEFKIMTKNAYDKEQNLTEAKIVKSYLQKGLSLTDQIRLWALDKRGIKLGNSDIDKFLTDKKLKRIEVDK